MFAVSTNSLRTQRKNQSRMPSGSRWGGGLNLVSQFTEFEVGGDKFYSKHFSKDYLKM